ncbi:reverse transcriptase domain-containing protein, partial [Tanacetum coccineum]
VDPHGFKGIFKDGDGELALLCSRMTLEEFDKVEKYVGGLPDNIQGNVMLARPKLLQEAIELANSLINQKVCAYAAKQVDNKRRMDKNPKDNHVQQLPYKRQNVARAYTTGPSEKKEYAGTLPLSPTAEADQRTLTCFKCGNQGHYRSECPTLKNQNCGNQTGNDEACGRVYALGGGEADQDPNNIADDTDA